VKFANLLSTIIFLIEKILSLFQAVTYEHEVIFQFTNCFYLRLSYTISTFFNFNIHKLSFLIFLLLQPHGMNACVSMLKRVNKMTLHKGRNNGYELQWIIDLRVLRIFSTIPAAVRT
jgi:hypothetical protein